MTHSKTKIVGIIAVACVLVVVPIVIVTLWVEKTATAFDNGKKEWFKCTTNMGIIKSKMQQALAEHPACASDISIPFLVGKGYLPEWSEVYICPTDFEIDFHGARLFDDEFRNNLETASLVAANYKKASYETEISNHVIAVKCRCHGAVGAQIEIPLQKGTSGDGKRDLESTGQNRQGVADERAVREGASDPSRP
ncbi:MAG: hypothetical protein ABFC77_03480 [Thermoguttaceae bacterium]